MQKRNKKPLQKPLLFPDHSPKVVLFIDMIYKILYGIPILSIL